jgi:type IV pilus assembly protein PilA
VTTVIQKIKTRMASEEGFTLIELLVVIIILGILVAIAVPAYLSFAGKAKTAAEESNVRSAIPAAESWYQTNSNTYGNISGANLRLQAPGISPHVRAGSFTTTNTDDSYCIDDTEDNGVTYFHYLGGAVSGAGAATITSGACTQTVS